MPDYIGACNVWGGCGTGIDTLISKGGLNIWGQPPSSVPLVRCLANGVHAMCGQCSFQDSMHMCTQVPQIILVELWCVLPSCNCLTCKGCLAELA